MPSVISDHFTYEELRLPFNAADADLTLADHNRLIMNYASLCVNVMEPLRKRYFDNAIIVTSGWRSPCRNVAAGGKEHSFHLGDDGHAAIDFKYDPATGLKLQDVFDWLRLGSRLPFDKVIIEYAQGAIVPSIIHVQYDRFQEARRQAFEGYTGASTEYNRVVVV